jgi:hypothetical protein
MSLPKDEAWFRAKTYGYGWGLPSRWQGWLVFLGYMIALMVPSFLLAPKHVVVFLVYVVFLSVVLVAVCMWKGETPKWRWGAETDDE